MNDIVLERIRQGAAGRAAGLAAAIRSPVSPEQRLGLPFTPGDRVFDVRSGQEGTVKYGYPARGTVLATFGVQLDSGGVVDRLAADLVGRPIPPVPDPRR